MMCLVCSSEATVSRPPGTRGSAPERGFSLVELMIVVAIIAILATLVVPSYSDYVRRSQMQEAFTRLADYRAKMEQYYLDNRNYGTADACAPVAASSWNSFKPSDARYFSYGCSTAGQTFTVTATGAADTSASGNVFAINEKNEKKTTQFKGKSVDKNCWLQRGNEC